jgi:hypothetical protein
VCDCYCVYVCGLCVGYDGRGRGDSYKGYQIENVRDFFLKWHEVSGKCGVQELCWELFTTTTPIPNHLYPV